MALIQLTGAGPCFQDRSGQRRDDPGIAVRDWINSLRLQGKSEDETQKRLGGGDGL